jgi:hypothetical protein
MKTGPHVYRELNKKYNEAQKKYEDVIEHDCKTKREYKSLLKKLKECREMFIHTKGYFEGFMVAVKCDGKNQEKHVSNSVKIDNRLERLDSKIKNISAALRDHKNSPSDMTIIIRNKY